MSKSFHWKTKINPEFQTDFCSSPGFLDLNEDSSKGKATANVCGIDKLKKKLWKLEPPKTLVIYPLNFDGNSILVWCIYLNAWIILMDQQFASSTWKPKAPSTM